MDLDLDADCQQALDLAEVGQLVNHTADSDGGVGHGFDHTEDLTLAARGRRRGLGRVGIAARVGPSRRGRTRAKGQGILHARGRDRAILVDLAMNLDQVAHLDGVGHGLRVHGDGLAVDHPLVPVHRLDCAAECNFHGQHLGRVRSGRIEGRRLRGGWGRPSAGAQEIRRQDGDGQQGKTHGFLHHSPHKIFRSGYI